MNDQVEGMARDFGGRAQEAVGAVTGDAKTRAEGVYNQTAGQAQQAAGQLGDMIKAQPILATVIGVGLGFLIGRLTS